MLGTARKPQSGCRWIDKFSSGANGIEATTKTVDLMSGGLLENRRSSGTFGMNAEARFTYKIYVKRADLESAKSVLAAI